MDTKLSQIKIEKPKSIKKNQNAETKKLKIALQKVHLNSFFQKHFSHVLSNPLDKLKPNT
jgi:hypothetical protein